MKRFMLTAAVFLGLVFVVGRLTADAGNIPGRPSTSTSPADYIEDIPTDPGAPRPKQSRTLPANCVMPPSYQPERAIYCP